jgi:exopolysaccharide biosynthesis polyprenyl glycosylphosphotransferase
MTATDEARADGVRVEPARRSRTATLPTRAIRPLFATRRWPWLVLDVVAVLALYEVGIRLSPYGGYRDIVSPYVALSVVFALAYGAVGLGLGSYDREHRFDYLTLVRNAALAAVLASLANLAFHYFTLYEVVGRLTLVYGAAFALAGSVLLRVGIAAAAHRHPFRFTVIGRSRPVSRTVSDWARQEAQAKLYVLVPWETIFANPAKPTVNELVEADIAEIVVAPETMDDQQAIDFALMSIRANVPVVDEHSFYAHLFERLPIDEVSKRWILESGLRRPQGLVVATKRLVDIAASAIGVVVLSPLLLAVALAVKLTSPGPVLFIQTRQGRFSQPFQMSKFRTMRHDDGHLGDTSFTRVDDVRVTPVGRVLRRAHLDELPQLFNILRGEMSLVGPRPETVEFATQMDAELPLYELRYLVRPGLTGHAQLKQGYAMNTVLDTRAKLSYDLYYLCNYSLALDLRILLRTTLFLVRGAR